MTVLARHVSLLPAVIALASCYSPDRTALAAEARKAVDPSASIVSAAASLGRIGFKCDRAVSGLTCTRLREYEIIASCVERIDLASTRGDARATISVPDIPCTSL